MLWVKSATRKQAAEEGGAFFVSLVLHLVGRVIATAYVVQEKMANEEMMQGGAHDPTAQTALKARSRPRVATH